MSFLGALLALSTIVLVGCGGGYATSSTPSGTRPPHARCLNESAPGADRPLFFLFCVQSP
jgi:hypothetical protein